MTRNPVLITSALLSALGPLVGNGIYAGPTGTDDQVLAAVREGLPTKAYAALSLELIGFTAMVVLFGWLVVFLARKTPVAAAATGIAGAACLAVKLGSAGPIMTAYTLADQLDATTVKMLIDFGDQAFVIDGLFTCIALCAAGVGLLSTDVPRWLAWWPAVAGALGVVAAIVGMVVPGGYFPLPFVLLLVWMLALAIRSALGGGVPEGQARRTAATMAA